MDLKVFLKMWKKSGDMSCYGAKREHTMCKRFTLKWEIVRVQVWMWSPTLDRNGKVEQNKSDGERHIKLIL